MITIIHRAVICQWFLILLMLSRSHPSDGSTKATFSPVSELGPSLAASIAGGTVIAVRSPRGSAYYKNGGDDVCSEDDDCIVLLLRSPDVGSKTVDDDGGASNLTVSSVYGSLSNESDIHNDNYGDNVHIHQNSITTSSRERERDALSPLFRGPVRHPFLKSSSSDNVRILHAPTGLLVAATGFKPDIDHLMHVATGKVLARTAVYDAPFTSSARSGKSLDPHRLVREDLSNIMIEEALASDGARPFGVQLLVTGQSAQANHLEVYTIDPSGGWRSHVGWGAAVGRGAERVRASFTKLGIADFETGEGRESTGWINALDRAMFAAVRAFEIDNQHVLDLDNDSRSRLYGAIVIFGQGAARREKGLSYYQSNTRFAAVHPDIVEISYKRCLQRLCKKELVVDDKGI